MKLLFLQLLLSLPAFGLTMPGSEVKRVGVTYDHLHMETPQTTSEDKLTYGVEMAIPVKRFTPKLFLTYTPDTEQRSQSVDIRENFISLYGLLGYDYLWGCRISASAGPGIITGITYYDVVKSTSKTILDYDIALMARAGISYLVFSFLELSLNLTLQERLYAKKTDWAYGMGLAYRL